MSAECGVRSAESCRTLLCFAMEQEVKGIQWKVLRTESKILVTGIGQQNTERAFRNLLGRLTPQRVFTCGFAGGLNADLKLGDVLFETGDAGLRDQLNATGAMPAKFFCAARIATTVAEKRELRRVTGADAVEMESDAIHAVCREQGIPCATVRVISDTADEDLPLDFNRLANPDLSLSYRKLAVAIAKSPGKILALMKFGRRTGFAAKRLGEVLMKVISSPQTTA